jgi:hypothetical protein
VITCTLGEKRYTVDFVTGRALREMEPASKMYAKVVQFAQAAATGAEVPTDANFTIPEAMDTMIRWFCLLFKNQFTPDEMLDNYPADQIMHDIAFALMAVQTQTTEVLSEFPTMAAREPKTVATTTAS